MSTNKNTQLFKIHKFQKIFIKMTEVQNLKKIWAFNGGNGEPRQPPIIIGEKSWSKEDEQDTDRWARLRRTFSKDSSLKFQMKEPNSVSDDDETKYVKGSRNKSPVQKSNICCSKECKHLEKKKMNAAPGRISSTMMQSLCFSCTNSCIAPPAPQETYNEEDNESWNHEETDQEEIETEESELAKDKTNVENKSSNVEKNGKKSTFTQIALKTAITLAVWAFFFVLYLAHTGTDLHKIGGQFVSWLSAAILGTNSRKSPSWVSYLFSYTEIPNVKAWCYICKYVGLPNILMKYFGS